MTETESGIEYRLYRGARSDRTPGGLIVLDELNKTQKSKDVNQQ